MIRKMGMVVVLFFTVEVRLVQLLFDTRAKKYANSAIS